MRGGAFIVRFVILLLVQIILAKYAQIGPFLYFTLLPAMLLCINPVRKTWTVMIIAFVCGIAVDGLADGVLGLNAAAAVLAGALQRPLLRLCIGEELVERGYSISFRRYGYGNITSMIFLATLAYMLAYTILDCAGSRSLLFCLGKIFFSSIACTAVQLCVVSVLCPYQK